MTAAAAPWQLDLLSAGAREAAETAARGAGVALSAWLTELINEACSAEGIAVPAEPPKILDFAREARVPSPPRLQPAPLPMPGPTLSVVPISAYRQQAPVQPAAQQEPSTEVPAGAPLAADAAMMAVAAMAAANLGTRRSDDVPDALLADIATHGMRQPVTMRRSAGDPERYDIVCGHRRWRAAQRVGLTQIPANVVAQDDATAILASLADNLQQGDLSAIDEAQAYLWLLTQYAIDVAAVTAAIGRERKHIVQSMRLLGLPPLVSHLVGSGALSREHACVLLDAAQPEALADAILTEHLSAEAARQRIAAGVEGTP